MTEIRDFRIQNVQNYDLLAYDSSNSKWLNRSVSDLLLDSGANVSTSTTYYIDSSTGDDSNEGTSSSPLMTFQEAITRTSNSGSLTAIFTASTTPYDFPFLSIPNNFNLSCRLNTSGGVDTYNQVYDTGTINSAVTVVSHTYAPYTYCDYTGTTQSIDDLSSSLVRFTSGALNGTSVSAIAFQADGKLILRGNLSTLVNGDTFEIRRHSVVLNMTSQQGGINQSLHFRSVELNANGNSLLPQYCKFIFEGSKFRLGGASYRPWSGGSLHLYDSYVSINTAGTFNITNNARSLIGSDIQVTNTVIYGRSAGWGNTGGFITDNDLQITTSSIYWTAGEINAGKRLRIFRSLILSSLSAPVGGSVYIQQSLLDQPSFHPSQRQSLLYSVNGTINEVEWRITRPTSGSQVLCTMENCKLMFLNNCTYTVTNSTSSMFVLSVNSELILRSNTHTFSGACAQVFNVANNSRLINNGTLDSTGLTCTYNILLASTRGNFINTGTLTNFQNGSSAVLRDDLRATNFNSTTFGSIISNTSNNFEINGGSIPLNNREPSVFSSNSTINIGQTNIIGTGGSTYTLPASNTPFNGKFWKIMNITGGSITIDVGASETGKIRDNSGTLVNTITMLDGSSCTFLYFNGIYYQYN